MEYLRVKDVSKCMGISVATVWLYTKQDKIKAIKLSDRVTVWAIGFRYVYRFTHGSGVMNKDFRNHLYVWTFEKIKSNPQKFGGDNSNALIMQEYSNEFFSGNHVMQLETKFYSLLSTVSRIKNKLLRNYPQFDCRNKYKPKKRKTDEVH